MPDLLTRVDEFLLTAVLELKDDAYGVTIREKLRMYTGETFSLGSIYLPLDRLVARGMLKTSATAPEPVRGGRSKRVYRVTGKGVRELQKMRELHAHLWLEVPLPQTN